MIKGYIIQYSGQHVVEDPFLSKHVPASVLQQIEKNRTGYKPTDWRPREEAIAIWRAIADAHAPQGEAAVYEAIRKTGEAVAVIATTTWLKLLMKILTPRMFAKKFPDMFARDHKFGHIEIESVDDHGMVVWFKDVQGYAYFGPFAHGWGGFGLRSIGVKDLKMTVTPWSLAEPAPTAMRVVATWA